MTLLYADDLLLCMKEVSSTLSVVLDIIQKFSGISGYKISSNKSSLLPLNKSIIEAQLTTDIPIYTNLEALITKYYKRLSIFNNIQ